MTFRQKSSAIGVIVLLLREHLFGISILACAAIAFAFPSAFTESGCRTAAWQGLSLSESLEAQSQRSPPTCFPSGWTSPAQSLQISGADINRAANDVWPQRTGEDRRIATMVERICRELYAAN